MRLTTSGKAIQFIDDRGVVFQAAASLVYPLLQGKVKNNHVLLTKMPFTTDPKRFGDSPLFEIKGTTPDAIVTEQPKGDVMDHRVLEKMKEKKQYKDVVVDF